MQKHTFKEWEALKAQTYEQKLEHSKALIKKAISECSIHSVSLSWGKDSVVMLHLIRTICKKSRVVFANTGIEYPETYKYRDWMLENYLPFAGMCYEETKPIKNFGECVKLYGYPHQRNPDGNKTSKRQPKCCLYLKEKPLDDFQKKHCVSLVFIGLQSCESMNRRCLFMRLGDYYYRKTSQTSVCYPLMLWNDTDVKRYAEENKIPLNPLYSQMKRTGCMFCTGFKDWKKVMAKYNPKMLAVIMRKKEGQESINAYCFQTIN